MSKTQRVLAVPAAVPVLVLVLVLGACGAPLLHAPAPEHDAANPQAPANAYVPPPDPLRTSAFEGEAPAPTGHEGHGGHEGHAGHQGHEQAGAK